MTTPYPSIDDLKAQARRLRQAMTDRGTPMSHSAALELLAHQHGARDWNTLSAQSLKPNTPAASRIDVGALVQGRYLDQAFTGRILALQALADGSYRITIHFDAPVDVVTSDSFSAFRRRINAQIDENGVSPRKTSNGVPHLVLDL